MNNRQMPTPPAAKAADETPLKDQAPVADAPAAPAVKPASKKMIQVVALRPGIYKKHRKVQGDKFAIESEDHFGTWMKKI